MCPKARSSISRRSFLRLTGVYTAGALVAGCRTVVTPEPPLPTATAAPIPTTTATLISTVPAAAQPTAAAQTTALYQVAVAQASSYEPGLVYRQVQAMLDGLGGLGDIIHSGDKVAIKINLTGGNNFKPPEGFSATESYVTHPEVVRALGKLLIDAGAGELWIVEAVYDRESYPQWGYQALAKELNATLVDLNSPEPYADFATTPVGEGWYLYETFAFNRILEEADAFISVAKMKCHWNAGVTLSMKNLIGLLPVSQYRQSPDHWWRSALHGNGDEARTRLPRIILDLNRARPIHLALIDGIKTSEGGEAPRGSFNPVQPGVLVVGKNALATDAAATAVMGFDPTIAPPTPPFIRTENYLNMARELGLGSNLLREIAVVGTPIEKVRYPFKPSWEQ